MGSAGTPAVRPRNRVARAALALQPSRNTNRITRGIVLCIGEQVIW